MAERNMTDTSNALPVIISTDNSGGVFDAKTWPGGAPMDDFAAIMQALNEPSVKVCQIAPMFGNDEMTAARFVTDFLVKNKPEAQDIPIYNGAALDVFTREYNRTVWFTEHLNLERMFPEEITAHEPPRSLGVNDAVSHMAEQLRAEATAILALGPLTDVAALVYNFPEVVKNIKKVVWLGGRSASCQLRAANPSDPTEVFHDLNYDRDPGSVDVVLRSGVEFVAVGGGLAFNADPPIKGLVELLQGGTTKTETKLRVYARALAKQITELGLLDTFPFDSIGLAALLFQDKCFECKGMGARILKCGETAPDFDGNVCTAPDETSALWFSKEFPSNGNTYFCHKFASGGSKYVQQRIHDMTY